MSSDLPDPPRTEWPVRLNLVIPGAGLVLLGSPAAGIVGGLAFAACANFALAAVLLIPDEFSGTTQALAVGLAVGTYVGVQLRLARAARTARATAATAWRRRVLWDVRAMLGRGEYAAALKALAPLVPRAPHDLLVAFRHAQLLSEVGATTEAEAAWRRVRTLDRHGIYKGQVRTYAAHIAAGTSGGNSDSSEAERH